MCHRARVRAQTCSIVNKIYVLGCGVVLFQVIDCCLVHFGVSRECILMN